LSWIRVRRGAPEPGKTFDLVAIVDDEQAFRRWYDETAPRVYAYLYSRTGSAATAEELTQETFVEVIRNPRNYDGRIDPVPWLVGVARHRLSHRFRESKRDDDRSRQMVRQIDVGRSDDSPWLQLERQDSVAAALDLLPRDQRAVLLLRFADDLTVREVARAIGRSEDATESLLRRARAAFESAYLGVDHDPG
jgi:RNA polymerase sigma-70 factor, ECF subfamily